VVQRLTRRRRGGCASILTEGLLGPTYAPPQQDCHRGGGRKGGGWESHGRSWGASAAVFSTRLMVMVSVRKKSDLSLRRAVETRVCLRGVFNSLRIQKSCLFQILAQRGNTLTKIPNIETYSKSPATFSKSSTTLTRCTPQTSSGLSGGCIDRFIDPTLL
jgi:hypothetical protein